MFTWSSHGLYAIGFSLCVCVCVCISFFIADFCHNIKDDFVSTTMEEIFRLLLNTKNGNEFIVYMEQ